MFVRLSKAHPLPCAWRFFLLCWWTRRVHCERHESRLPNIVLQNAGDAYVYGAELELRKNFRLGPGRLMSSLALSTQDGEFRDGATALLDTNDDGTPDQADLGGKQVPRLRDYQLTVNLAYTAPLGERLTGIAGLSIQAANGGYETPENSTRPASAQAATPPSRRNRSV